MPEDSESKHKHVTRRQHYVPRSYLCHFTSFAPEDKNCIWTYDKNGGCPRLQSPVSSAVEKDIYSIKDSNTKPSDYIETEILTPIENEALPILDRLRLDDESILNNAEFMKVVAYMAILHLRVPKSINRAKEFLEAGANEYLRLIGENPQKIKEWCKKRQGKDLGNALTEEQMTEAMKFPEKHVKIKAKKDYVLANILPQFQEIGKQLVMLDWSICSSPDKYFFITSDTPVVVFCPYGKDKAKFGIGFALPQVEIHFPLSPTRCLFGSRRKYPLKWTMCRSDIDQVNMRCIYSAHRFVFSAFKSNRISKVVSKAVLTSKKEVINKEILREQLKKHMEGHGK